MRLNSLAGALALALSTPLFAAVDANELAALKAELERLQTRISALEAQATVAAAPAAVSTPNATTEPAAAPSEPSEAPKALEFSGRAHFDAYAFDRDQRNVVSGSEFRRLRFHVEGEFLSGFSYDIAYEVGGDGGADGIRNAFLAKSFGNTTLMLGQFKPFRSMAELTSSNDLVVQERPFSSGTGLFTGRQWQQAIGVINSGDAHSLGFALTSLRNAGTDRNQGYGLTARATFAPLLADQQVLHLGGWFSREQAGRDTPAFEINAIYAGRRGPRDVIAATDDSQGTLAVSALEAAYAHGGWLLQSEIARARLDDALTSDARIRTGYLQASWLLNGGHRPYAADEGLFDSPEGSSLWELTARLDAIRRSEPDPRTWRSTVLGINYHYNEQLSWQLNFTDGDSGDGRDQTSQWALRTLWRF
jgi:phosphate-selective porin OprO and OprP